MTTILAAAQAVCDAAISEGAEDGVDGSLIDGLIEALAAHRAEIVERREKSPVVLPLQLFEVEPGIWHIKQGDGSKLRPTKENGDFILEAVNGSLGFSPSGVDLLKEGA